MKKTYRSLKLSGHDRGMIDKKLNNPNGPDNPCSHKMNTESIKIKLHPKK